MNFPLANKLKKRLHLETATLQDEVVDLIYSISSPVLHGGTAIWRCYAGNRFSEDLDFYMPRDK
ncbi:MAG: nucleotidyl transferase AbiEii/AbiGii toxin family protein, partial [Candidatus Micrarchaeota archaeon]